MDWSLLDLIERSFFDERTRMMREIEKIMSGRGIHREPRSRQIAEHVRPCRHCRRLFGESDLRGGVCPDCGSRRRSETGTASRSAPCAGCGIRFSSNLLRDGLCAACRDQGKTADTGASAPAGRLTADLLRSYEILGCQPDQTDDEIKRRRRVLVKECHADRLPQESPRTSVDSANQRFRKIQEAFDSIMRSRGGESDD